MKCSVPCLHTFVLACLCGPARAFYNHGAALAQPSHQIGIVNNNDKALFAYFDDDDMKRLLPETSFGAEVVPEGQRPVNEYLDLVRAPLFGWASEDVGSKGLMTRLFSLYVTSFAAV